MQAAPLICILPGNEALGLGIASACGGEPCRPEIHRFPDGEQRLCLSASVAGRDAVLVCSLEQPDAKMATLHFAASLLRELGARRILLTAPYLPYLRQDRAFASGQGIQARHYASWLSGLIDGLVTLDPHLHRIRSLSQIYTVPCVALSAAPAIAAHLRPRLTRPLLIGPDRESAQWLQPLAQQLGVPCAVLGKKRLGDRQVQIDLGELPPPDAGLQPVLVDDIAASGATLLEGLRLLRARGYPPALCVVVHALCDEALDSALREAGATQLLSCNGVAHPSNAIDVRPLLAQATASLLGTAPAPQASLPCPLCGKPVGFSSALEGSGLVCPHCARRLVLERQWPGHSGEMRWALVEGGDEDEP